MPDKDAAITARSQAQAQWNTNPCGAVDGDLGDPDYFDRVEAERYRQQYWQQEFFDYKAFAGKNVLEIGVGLGTDLRQFAVAGARTAGADITERHLQLTAENFARLGKDIDLRKADAAALPFGDGSFDCVHSFGVLHHIPDVDSVLAEIFRVLKPGGVLQCAVYHRYALANATLLLRGMFTGRLFRLGYRGLISQVEKGADGSVIKPYVKLYSRSGWRRKVEAAGFVTERLAVKQVFFDGLRLLNVFRPMEGILGWYVAGIFRKNG